MLKDLEVAKAKGLIDGAIRKLMNIKLNLTFDNITDMPVRLNEVYEYFEALDEIATNVKKEETEADEGLER